MPPVLPLPDVPLRDMPDRLETPLRGNPFPDDPSAEAREGSTNITGSVKQWYMIVQEDTPLLSRGHRITGQFTPQQVSRNLGANIVESGGYGRDNPIIQWIGGKLKTWTFQARLFSAHRDDGTAAEKIQELEYLVESHPGLGRPPLVTFFWGTAVPDGFPCFVEDLSPTYDEIREDGSIRGVTLNITLKKYTEFQFELASPNRAESTPAHVVKHGETYEMIALRRYGDPMLGVLLRQMNPRSPMNSRAPSSVADLQQGDEVKIYPIRDMRRKTIRPLCHVLRTDNAIAADNRRYFFELRSSEIAPLPRK